MLRFVIITLILSLPAAAAAEIRFYDVDSVLAKQQNYSDHLTKKTLGIIGMAVGGVFVAASGVNANKTYFNSAGIQTKNDWSVINTATLSISTLIFSVGAIVLSRNN